MAYERVTGPIGPERLDALVALLAATVSNTARAKGRKAGIRDFMPTWDQGRQQSWQEMLAAVRTMNRRLGGTEGGGHVAA